MPRLTTLVLGFITAILCGSLFAAGTQPTIQSSNKTPLAFTKNMGQWDSQVLFRANAGGATMWFTKEGVTYQFTRRIPSPPSPLPRVGEGWSKTGEREVGHSSESWNPVIDASSLDSRFRGNDIERDSVEQLVLIAKFVGANPNPEVSGEGQMEYKCNYFLGNDPTKWHTDVPNYEAITFKDIYPGIDLKYSGDGNGQAAYEFVVAPGADIAQIKVEYEGAKETLLDPAGRLIVRTKWGDMIAAIKTPTNGVLSGSGSFSQLSEKTIGFEANASSRQALGTFSVGLAYSTYLGGSSYENPSGGGGIAVDDSGYAYVTGSTWSSDFPTVNPYQTHQGTTSPADVFVTKLSSTGNNLIYSTYLGGGDYDYGWGIAVDGSGNAYVTGGTNSSNFPTQNPFQTDQGGWDAFVTKLSSSGNSLIYSTYLGGSGSENYFGGGTIAVDGSGNTYVTGITSSSNFPTLNPYQTYQGYYDVFVTKLSSFGNSLIYSTYLGGRWDDVGNDIAVDGNGCAYVTGYTDSDNFPTLNPYQTDQGGGDVFVTKLSSSGASLIYSTYLGGSGSDNHFGGGAIAVDGSGYAYVTGVTNSTDFPTLNPYQGTFQGGNYDVFVTKLSSSGNSLIYSTYLGGGGWDWGRGIAVDGSGNAYVIGETNSTDFPTLNPYQSTLQGGYYAYADVFVTKLSNSGNSLIYSTYLGGTGSDYGRDIAVDGSGYAYVTGETHSYNFPTLNPYQSTYQGDDAFVTKLHFDGANDVSDELTPVSLPEKPALDQNYPNPFNPSTKIGFDLPRPSFVSLDIFDVLGRKVSTLINDHLTAGSKRVQWNGRDNTGAEVASGVYFYRLRIGDHVEVKKMVLLK
jgi:hypothetical protein